VTDAEVLISAVQMWAAELVPDDPHVRRWAAALALSACMGAASLSEACHEARLFLTGRDQHPAGRGGFPARPVPRVAE
jgi:hypothetical protein